MGSGPSDYDGGPGGAGATGAYEDTAGYGSDASPGGYGHPAPYGSGGFGTAGHDAAGSAGYDSRSGEFSTADRDARGSASAAGHGSGSGSGEYGTSGHDPAGAGSARIGSAGSGGAAGSGGLAIPGPARPYETDQPLDQAAPGTDAVGPGSPGYGATGSSGPAGPGDYGIPGPAGPYETDQPSGLAAAGTGAAGPGSPGYGAASSGGFGIPGAAGPYETESPSGQAAAADASAGASAQPAGATRGQRARAERGRAERRRQARRVKRRRRRSLIREFPVVVIVALGITLLLQTFAVQVFSIPSGSMQDTIQIGDRVVVNKFSPWFGWQPQRGDVVVFKDPGHWLDADGEAPSKDGPVLRTVKGTLSFLGLLPSDQNLIKRVIGLPGDTVACCDTRGRLTVNGTPLDEGGYLFPGNPPSQVPFKVTVPAGDLWVMGDHRSLSADSRSHMDQPGRGFVPESDVVGRAVAVVWPVGRVRTLPVPSDFAAIRSPGADTASGPSPGAGGSVREGGGVENLGQSSAAVTSGPLLGELPLVMGLAVGRPRVRTRRRRRR